MGTIDCLSGRPYNPTFSILERNRIAVIEERAQRRLAAILAADVVGYTSLMEQDEAGTLAVLKERRKGILKPLVAEHHGGLRRDSICFPDFPAWNREPLCCRSCCCMPRGTLV